MKIKIFFTVILIVFFSSCRDKKISSTYKFPYTYQGQTLYYNVTSSNTVEVTSNCPDSNRGIKGKVVIPSKATYKGNTFSVTSIDRHAFLDCRHLTSVKIPSSVTSIDWYAFAGCTNLKDIEIPSSVTSIGWYAFSGCSSLTSIEIPPSMTSIDEWVFEDCSSLRNITIPSSVTTLGYWTFHNCSSLNSIDIPSSVTYIGKGSFAGCSDIDTIYSRNPYPPTIENESTFDDISRDNTAIFVPKGSIEAYKKAVIWDQFSNIQEY